MKVKAFILLDPADIPFKIHSTVEGFYKDVKKFEEDRPDIANLCNVSFLNIFQLIYYMYKYPTLKFK
tara:strand:+ start:4124 stop:4324 length:201 start_codon:yes stop_codon:yes gene_type:complete